MLIAMAVHDKHGSGRSVLTRRAVESALDTIDLSRHRFIISDDASTDTNTIKLYSELPSDVVVIEGANHVGTAATINRAWRRRKKDEHCVKMDNDVIVHKKGWADLLEYVLDRDPRIGIAGFKRNDLKECPGHEEEYYRSRLEFLPHESGEPWTVVEVVNHVMGTCQAYSSSLLSRFGYLYQMQDQGNKYGYDDGLASFRANMLGFRTVFVHGVEIDHIDPGGTEYAKEKLHHYGVWAARYYSVLTEYRRGERNLYYGGP